MKLRITLLLRPPTSIEDIVQSFGRGGRRRPGGKTQKVLCITLYNNEDISNSVEGMTEGVRLFCQETGCLRKFLHASMGGGSLGPVIPGWCCGPCSGL